MAPKTMKELGEIIKTKQFLIVHYSCSSLQDFPVEIGAVGCLDGQTMTEQKFTRNDNTEKVMISQFLKFFKTKMKEGYSIVGWNFNREIYGLQPILRRYETLMNKSFPLNHNAIKAYDLDEIIKGATDFKGGLHNIALYNSMTMKSFIFGKEEIQYLKEKKFQELDNSVMRKIAIMRHVLELCRTNKLIVEPSLTKRIYARYFVISKDVRIFFHRYRIEIMISVVTTLLGLTLENLIRAHN